MIFIWSFIPCIFGPCYLKFKDTAVGLLIGWPEILILSHVDKINFMDSSHSHCQKYLVGIFSWSNIMGVFLWKGFDWGNQEDVIHYEKHVA